MQLSTTLPVGNYPVQVISDQQTSSVLSIVASTTTNSSTTGSGVFITQTDKSNYNNGDFIQVIGAGQAGASITGALPVISDLILSGTGRPIHMLHTELVTC